MNRIILTLALLIAIVGVQAASGQYVVYYPSTAAYTPVTTYYSPATSYYSYYAPTAVPTTSYYYGSAPAPVTTYYAPSYSYYAPSYSYYAPTPVYAAPTTYVTRYRPILGGTVTTAYYGYAPRSYVYWRY